MLDAFLEVAYEKEKQASIESEVIENLKQLPDEELHKIVRGETKLAFHADSGGCWLDQFKGTPMYEQALALETQSLELDVADQQKRQSERQERDAIWDQRDAISVQKRMLELDLRKQEAGMGAGGEELPEPVEAEEPEEVDEEEDKKAAVDKLAAARGAMVIEEMRKEALGLKPWGERSTAEKIIGTGGEVGGAAVGGLAGLGLGHGVAKAAPHVADALIGRLGGGSLKPGMAAHNIVSGIQAGAPLIGAGMGTLAGGLAGGHMGEKRRKGKASKSKEEEKTSAVIAEMRMEAMLEKSAKQPMGPLRAAEYWEDPIGEAAWAGRGMGQLSPEMLQMMQQQARGDIAGQIGEQAESAKYIKEHPIKGRLPGAALGAALGGIGGMAGGLGLKGTLATAGLGGLAGAALTPGVKAREAELAQMQEASGSLTDPALQAALQRSAIEQAMEQKHQRGMEKARAKGTNAAIIQGLMQPKQASAFDVSDAWGREMAKAAANEAAEAAFEKMASGIAFEDLDEMEKEAILTALKAGLPAAQRFLGRAGQVLGKTYQKGGGGWAGVMEAGKKLPGLARGAASRVARSGVGQQIAGGLQKVRGAMPTMAGAKDKAFDLALSGSAGLAGLRDRAGMAVGQALSGG